MRNVSDLNGIPVLAVATGKQIGTVEEVLVSLEAASVRGIIVACAGWFSEQRKIPFAAIHRLGSDAVMVREEYVGAGFDSMEIDRLQTYDWRYLAGKSIFSESGIHMGTLVGLDFDPETGEIKTYQVSDGVIADLLYGRANMPRPEMQVVCEDRMIIPESMTKLLHP